MINMINKNSINQVVITIQKEIVNILDKEIYVTVQHELWSQDF